ncbi:MAG: hypothetical protein LBT88_06400, partial [Oscillospiraceae bacterium]|nr:hypothetical protein [Oscillospiraceae bacterium]
MKFLSKEILTFLITQLNEMFVQTNALGQPDGVATLNRDGILSFEQRPPNSVQESNPHYLGYFMQPEDLPPDSSVGDFADMDATGTEWVWTSDDPAGWTDSGNPIGTTPHWITVDLNYLYQLLGDV